MFSYAQDQTYRKREVLLYDALDASGALNILRECAQARGFGKTALKMERILAYIVAELARDDISYDAAMNGYYEPEQYRLLADIYLTRLEEAIQPS